ncbi:uncharacterized protein LOC106980362 [Acinonyx jubatus]|uniref:Uncharacterized protein LOC106980362 n=1 Tax=Acinonyx jubatus TaxID=32536 RepID=A0ABM3NCN8_ACIJB|nr:uncharacterized protein LOC106980362 [Acinonyx jubatus]
MSSQKCGLAASHRGPPPSGRPLHLHARMRARAHARALARAHRPGLPAGEAGEAEARAPVTDRRGGGAERAPRSLQSQEIRKPAYRAPKPPEILLGSHVKGSLKVKTQVWEHQEPSRTTVQGQAILSKFPSSPSCPGRPLGFRWLRLIPSCFRAGTEEKWLVLDRDSLVSNLYQRLPRSRWSENFEFLSPATGPFGRVAPLATSRTSGGTFWNGRMHWLRICREEVTSSAHPTVVPQSELGNKD